MSLKKSSAWKWFAKYIKERDRWACITCGKKAIGWQMNTGHFIQAFGNAGMFFREDNVHAQCVLCNTGLNGNLLEYRRQIIKKYGEGYDEKLEKDARNTKGKQYTKKELKEIAKVYRDKYRKLCQEIEIYGQT